LRFSFLLFFLKQKLRLLFLYLTIFWSALKKNLPSAFHAELTMSAGEAPPAALGKVADDDRVVHKSVAGCELAHSKETRVVLMTMTDMSKVTEQILSEFLALVSTLLSKAPRRDTTDPDSGTTLVFDATHLKNIDVFSFVPCLKRWAEKNASVTEVTVRCTFIRVSTKAWRDIFSTLLKMFKHTRPVHVVTDLPCDSVTGQPRIPPNKLQQKQAQRARMEEQRRLALRRT
jgi:hypothetical protein